MNFDIYALYMCVGLISALIIGIIRNRTRATAYKDTVDKTFLWVLLFFIVFCVFDAIWGLIGSQLNAKSPLTYEISTYLFHLLSATSSFIVALYARHFFKLKRKVEKILLIVSSILFVGQLCLLLQNIGTKTFFSIDDNGVYHTGYLRRPAFYLQFLQYVPYMIFAIVYAIYNRRKETGKRKASLYLSGAFFLAIPLIFGILQMLFPDGPFYSAGFAVFSVAIYAIIVTKQRETFLGDFHRVEEQKRSFDAINKALKIAEEANNSKSQFLANMSHDIRTPINGIMGMTSLALQEELTPKTKDYLLKIEKTSQHLLSLVNDVLDMSLIENKQDQIINEDEINLKTVIDNCGSIISGQLINRKIDFKINYINECSHSLVFGDELRLKQIFINILGNSIKFTPDDGEIVFNIKEENVTENHVTYSFSLSDSGCGMSKEFLTHLFEPFQQEKNQARTKYQGTGLGMAITKQLVDLMDGTINVESKQNVGTTFNIVIPFKICKKSTKNALISEKIKENISLEGLRIMLVEDNEINMEIAQTILENSGAIVTPCFNGKEAVDTFLNSNVYSFDAVLMDIMMPVMNGYEATKLIRNSKKDDAKLIPIIAMTANAFENDKKEALLAGMNGHVSKPVDFKLLAEEIYKFAKKD